jgi:hypothetical protein
MPPYTRKGATLQATRDGGKTSTVRIPTSSTAIRSLSSARAGKQHFLNLAILSSLCVEVCVKLPQAVVEATRLSTNAIIPPGRLSVVEIRPLHCEVEGWRDGLGAA